MKRFLIVVLAATFLLSGCNTNKIEGEKQNFSYLYSIENIENGKDKVYINNFNRKSNDLEKIELGNEVNVFQDAYSIDTSIIVDGYRYEGSEIDEGINNLYRITDRKKNKLTKLKRYGTDPFKYKEKVYLMGKRNAEVIIVDDKKIDTVDIPIFAREYIGVGDNLYIIGENKPDRKVRELLPMNINNNKLGKPIELPLEYKLPLYVSDSMANFFSLGEDLYYRECLSYSISKNKDENVFYKKFNKKTNKFETFDFKKEGFNIESYFLDDFREWTNIKSYQEKTYILMDNTIKVIDGKSKKIFEKEISKKVTRIYLI